VAALAELRGGMAIAAIRFARVGRARMTRDEILRVVTRLPASVRAVTLETHRSLVAGLARPGAGACHGAVSLPEFQRVARRLYACP